MGNVSRCCGCSYEDSFISDCCNVEMYKCNKFVIIVPSSKVDNLTMNIVLVEILKIIGIGNQLKI